MKMSRKNKKIRILLIPAGLILLLSAVFIMYVEQYYRADEAALTAFISDEKVRVEQTDYGWLFDGPSITDALVFYPGAKVEETAYGPLLRLIAERGMDVCLVKMPFRLALFAPDKAGQIFPLYDYDKWYIGGHSLGGAIAAIYAADNSPALSGLIMLAAYPSKTISEDLRTITIYGSNDGVIDSEKITSKEIYLPADHEICVIEGGNHAQFGNYGHQKYDGVASISAEKQQRLTAELIFETGFPAAGS